MLERYASEIATNHGGHVEIYLERLLSLCGLASLIHWESRGHQYT